MGKLRRRGINNLCQVTHINSTRKDFPCVCMCVYVCLYMYMVHAPECVGVCVHDCTCGKMLGVLIYCFLSYLTKIRSLIEQKL